MLFNLPRSLRRTALAVGALALSSTASFAAAITIETGNNTVAGAENVGFNDGSLISSGTTVQGALSSGTVVNFTSPTALTTPSAGRVEGDGSTFTDLTIALDGSTFTGVILNLNVDNPNGGPPETGTVDFLVNYLTPAGASVSESFNVSSAGQNFFTIFAEAGVDIQNVMLSLTGVTALDVRQIRIAESGDGTPSPVPAPAGLALLGLGLIALSRIRRKPV